MRSWMHPAMDRQASVILVSVVLAALLVGCATPAPVAIRCPAAPPDADIKCEACPQISPVAHPPHPKPIEQLESRYLLLLADFLGLQADHEACRVRNEGCIRRDGVWQESWDGCGD